MNELLKIGDKFSFKENVSGCIIFQIYKNMIPYDKGAYYIGAHQDSFYSPNILGPIETFSSKDEFVVVEIRDENSCINVIYTIAERNSDKKRVHFEQVVDDEDRTYLDEKRPQLYPKFIKKV